MGFTVVVLSVVKVLNMKQPCGWETVATGDARVSITSLTATPSGRLAVDLRHASCLVLTAHTFSLIQSKPVHYIHHSLNLVL